MRGLDMGLGNYRWLKLGLLGLLSLLLLAVVVVYMLVDTRKVAGVAASVVERQTGRSLALNGPISLHLFPHLSVVAKDVAFGNPSWAHDPVMIKADQVSISLAWMPLLHQQIDIDEVKLTGVVVNLEAAPSGQTVAGNWIIDASTPQPASTNTASQPMNLKSIQLTDVSVRYRDEKGQDAPAIVVDSLGASLTDSQLNFSGRLRWQNQPLSMQGKVAFPSGQPLRVDMTAQADRLDLRSQKPAVAAATSGSGRLFNSQPLGFGLLPLINGEVDVAVKSLVLPSGIELPSFSSHILLDAGAGGVLTLEKLSAGFGQGVINARGQLAGYSTQAPRLTLRGHARGFTIEKLVAQMEPGQKSSMAQGGPGEIAFNLNATGASASGLAGSMNGQIQASIGAAKLSKAFVNSGGDFTMSLIDAVNPLSKSSDFTQLECAAAYLPISSGVVAINRSVGLETDRLNVVLDGQINLHNENLNIRIYPKEKSGLTTGVNIAGLVQINGTLQNPKLGVNKAGVVNQAANVGLAVATGGISLAAQNLAGVTSKASACQNILRSWATIDDTLVVQH